jgi:hypothetical protein
MLENSTAVLHDARSKTTGNQHAQVIGSSLVGLPNIKN